MTTNYLQMMIDSLNKKKDILIRIIELNEEQNQILSEETLNGDAFDDNMKAKGSCIDELDLLDEGFQSLFNRVRDAINANKEMYANEISVMKRLITEVTELGAKIEVQEARNKVKVEAMFRRERQEHKEAKRSVYVPKVDEHFVGSLAVIPLQLLGYYVSVARVWMWISRETSQRV